VAALSAASITVQRCSRETARHAKPPSWMITCLYKTPKSAFIEKEKKNKEEEKCFVADKDKSKEEEKYSVADKDKKKHANGSQEDFVEE